MNRIEADMAAARYLAENAALKSQVRWVRKMLRRAYALIRTDLDDEDDAAEWLKDYKRGMRPR